MSVPPKCPTCNGDLILVIDEPFGRSWDCSKCDFTFDEQFDEKKTVNGSVHLDLGDLEQEE